MVQVIQPNKFFLDITLDDFPGEIHCLKHIVGGFHLAITCIVQSRNS